MLDNDNLTYGKPRRIAGGGMQPERVLLTSDRSQKLDLLIHLLTNLRQSLIVSGPDGIGKTTLLKTLQDSHGEVWPICILRGSSGLSFESVITQLSQFLNLSSNSVHFDMSSLRAFCEKQKVVLIIDDAGDLVPGLIGELIDFADSLSGLRLVFSMNFDEFQTKSASDKALDDCHYIELPPLNQRQCLEYLQNLSAQPGTPLSFKAVTDDLVETLYCQTQGIPGKLLNELPKLNQYQSRRQRGWGLWVGVAMVVAAAGFVAKSLLPENPPIFPGSEQLAAQPQPAAPNLAMENTGGNAKPAPDSEPPVQLDVVSPPAQPTMEQPQISNEAAPLASLPAAPMPAPMQIAPLAEPPSASTLPNTSTAIPAPLVAHPVKSNEPAKPATPVITEKPVETDVAVSQSETTKPVDNNAQTSSDSSVQVTPTAEPLLVPEQKTADSKATKTSATGSGQDWIMAQPPKNVTLQVMTLSTKDAAQRFMKKYADYGEGLTYYPVTKNGQEKFVVIYGSFESVTEARQYKEIMPGEFKQALEKSFKAVQQESRR